MISKMKLKGNLKANNKLNYPCEVKLEIDVINDWSKQIDLTRYIDGVRITGILSFESPPLDGIRNKFVTPGKVEIILQDGDDTTKMSIYLIENFLTENVIPQKLKKYYWYFYAVDKPVWDKLEIFPKRYRGKNMSRIYTCTNFRGYWPTQVSAVVVADSMEEAREILADKMRSEGITVEDKNYFEFQEVDILCKSAIILNDGKYN